MFFLTSLKHDSLRYKFELSCLLGIICVWLIGPGFNASYMIPTSKPRPEDGHCNVFVYFSSFAAQRALGLLTFVLQFLIPIIILIFCYGRMVRTLWVNTIIVLSRCYQQKHYCHQHHSRHCCGHGCRYPPPPPIPPLLLNHHYDHDHHRLPRHHHHRHPRHHIIVLVVIVTIRGKVCRTYIVLDIKTLK